MKKLASLLLVFVVICFTCVSFAADSAELTKVQNYYKVTPGLSNFWQICAVEALGLDSSASPFTTYDTQSLNYDDMYASTLAQEVIALVASGINPREVQVGYSKKDLVALLESYVRADGQITKDLSASGTDANYQIWPMFALYIVNSDYDKDKALEYLFSTQNPDGGLGFGSWSDHDVTGWTLNLLSLLEVPSNYKSNIDNMIAFIKTTQNSDGSWGSWGVNSNTQASVISGLLSIDKANFLAGAYDKAQDPYDLLLTFMNTDGWFGWDNNTVFNDLATSQSAIAIGEMANGNIYKRLHTKYLSIINNEDNNNGSTTNNTTNNTTNTTNNSTDNSVNNTTDRTTNSTSTSEQNTTNNYYTADPKIVTVTNTKEIIREVAVQQAIEAAAQGSASQSLPDNNTTNLNPVINVNMPDYSDEIKYFLSLLTVLVGVYAIKVGVNLWRK